MDSAERARIRVPGCLRVFMDRDRSSDNLLEPGCAWGGVFPEKSMPMLTRIDLPPAFADENPRLSYEFTYYPSEPADVTACRHGVLREVKLGIQDRDPQTSSSVPHRGHFVYEIDSEERRGRRRRGRGELIQH